MLATNGNEGGTIMVVISTSYPDRSQSNGAIKILAFRMDIDIEMWIFRVPACGSIFSHVYGLGLEIWG